MDKTVKAMLVMLVVIPALALVTGYVVEITRADRHAVKHERVRT